MQYRKAERNIKRHSFTFVCVPAGYAHPVWNLEIEHWKLQAGIISLTVIMLFSFLINRYSPQFITTLSSYRVATLEQQEYQQKLERSIATSLVLKDRLRELRSREMNLRDLLSLSPRSRLGVKKEEYTELPVITTQQVESDRGMFGKVLVDDKPILEFIDKIDPEQAERRAALAADRIKKLVMTTPAIKKLKLIPSAQNMENISVEYNAEELFTVTKADAAQFGTTPYFLAQKWRDDLIDALDIGKKDRLSTRIIASIQDILNKRKEKQYTKLEAFFSEIDYPAQTVSGIWQVNDPRMQKVNHMISFIKRESGTRQSSYNDLANTVFKYKERYAVTPSQSPVPYSFVLSSFGLRRHPITGKLAFHAGVDLPTFWEAPIYAAAAGKVSRQGWFGGYGWTIEIDHGYGIKTLYGHNSSLLTYAGQYVKKGQIIARAGRSGLATGVHSHYEVRIEDHPVNPMRFINLDIFTACKSW